MLPHRLTDSKHLRPAHRLLFPIDPLFERLTMNGMTRSNTLTQRLSTDTCASYSIHSSRIDGAQLRS